MRCRVALVLSERIAWEDSVRFPHPTVTGHFSDVGSSSNRVANTVSLHDRKKWEMAFPKVNEVQQQMSG